jgi:hypothetical protein
LRIFGELKFLFTIVLLFVLNALHAQTIGGSTVFNFLTLPSTPQLTALGGVNFSQPSNDVGLAFNNPAQLKPSMHTQLNAVFNDYYAGITAYQLNVGYHAEKLNTNFSWGLHFINYGSTESTDASGNSLGNFHPVDWVMQVSASRRYMERWNYGATLKLIHSDYGQYKSGGVAMDVGVMYEDTGSFFSASILAKNMGAQFNPYDGTQAGDLPFDLIVGLTKRLRHAPFSFSFTAHHLHQFDIRYNDPLYSTGNGKGFDKIFRHFVVATTVYVGERLEFQAGYNHLQRQELNVGETGNGLNGFSMGLAVFLNKLHLRFARTNYQGGTGYNQFGISLRIKS